MNMSQSYQKSEDNMNKVKEMLNILQNMVIPKADELNISDEWEKLLSMNNSETGNHLKTTIYHIINNANVVCDKCSKIAVYKTNDANLCWLHSI